MLVYRSPELIERYWLAKRATSGEVNKPKAWVWEQFGKAMENDYWMASNFSGNPFATL